MNFIVAEEKYLVCKHSLMNLQLSLNVLIHARFCSCTVFMLVINVVL